MGTGGYGGRGGSSECIALFAARGDRELECDDKEDARDAVVPEGDPCRATISSSTLAADLVGVEYARHDLRDAR